MSTFWFQLLTPSIIESHVIATEYAAFPSSLQDKLALVKDQVEGRSMLVKRAEVVPIEAIVRGYITGSGWKEYTKSVTVHGISLPKGLVESQEIPGGPLFTPSTKAEQGQHDENIHPDKGEHVKNAWKQIKKKKKFADLIFPFVFAVADLVGAELADRISKAAVDLYTKAAQHAQSRGIILADTKFEFGLLDKNQLILVDEVLTPDSSRFWDANSYKVGTSQASFDKQYVRDWLKSKGLDKAADQGVSVALPEDVVQKTAEKYQEAYERITGNKWQA